MSNAEYAQKVLADSFTPIRVRVDQNEVVAYAAIVIERLHRDALTIASVIGGAASGKSTIAEELATFLQKNNIRADMLCTDNYAKGDRHYRQVTLKDADAKRKYDLELMDEHIQQIRSLTEGHTIHVPTIDDKSGIAADADEGDFTYEIGALDVLVIEGDLPRDDYDVRFYIHVPDVKRLQNNIERDVEPDDTDAAGALIENFNTRQRTLHKPYTLPALESADYVIATDAEGDTWWYTMYKRKDQ